MGRTVLGEPFQTPPREAVPRPVADSVLAGARVLAVGRVGTGPKITLWDVFGTPENGYLRHNVHELRLNLNGGFTLNGEWDVPDARLEPILVTHGGPASFLRL